jgi:formylglycine-generating enzyme required for sulfatase activity
VRFHQIIAAAWLTLLCAAAAAHAEKRVALVIGNDRYPNLPAHQQLQKAVNDAQAVGSALTRIGFEVIAGENLDRRTLVRKLGELTQRLGPGDTAFFFFSGHGVALDGVNYILPADMPDIAAGQETGLKGEALSEPYIVQELTGRGVRVAVVVLDACRTNPFSRPGGKGVGAGKGLVAPPQAQGVFSLYAAGSGQEALDRLYDGDRSPNSVFSRVLVPALTRPGIDLATLAIEVREEVARIAKTAGYAQRPAYYDETIGGRVYLNGEPLPGAPGTAGVPAGTAADEVAWSFLKDTRDPEQLRRFIAQYPASARRGEAGARLSALEQTNAAVTAPVRPADSIPAGSPCSGATTVSLASRRAVALTAAEECSLKQKDAFRECENCPEMVVVPAGSFTMGSPEGELGSYGNESPQHIVTIGKPFAVGKTHVTRDQFAAFAKETRYAAHSKCSWSNPGFAQEGSHPVVCVKWDGAKAYADWLTKKTGKPYRLLSDAEWEYAARGRTSPGAYPRFWFGDEEKQLCRYGNFGDQEYGASNAPCNDGYKYTSPAGRFEPNAFGLYDMFGNAWQWTADCWHSSYNGAPDDGSAWTAGCEDTGRVVRGGSWDYDLSFLRAGYRNRYTADDSDYIGFRLARMLTP